jgi:hypothetical protein
MPRKQTPFTTRDESSILPLNEGQQILLPHHRTHQLGKRTRDDELHELVLKRARLEVERQEKALLFEEDLHRRQLAQYEIGAPGVNRRPNNVDDEEEGEIPPEVKEVVLLFPAISQKEIAAIFDNKFDPRNLYKLYYRKVCGKIRTKKRTGTAKDYPHPDPGWPNCRRCKKNHKEKDQSLTSNEMPVVSLNPSQSLLARSSVLAPELHCGDPETVKD